MSPVDEHQAQRSCPASGGDLGSAHNWDYRVVNSRPVDRRFKFPERVYPAGFRVKKEIRNKSGTFAMVVGGVPKVYKT